MSDEMISLFAWSKLYSVHYRTAHKMASTGVIAGVERKGSRILVPKSSLPPVKEKIRCEECGAMLSFVSSTHLVKHGMTPAEYKVKFPGAPLATEESKEKVGAAKRGVPMSEAQKIKVSQGRKGIIPKNHPRYVKGVHKASQATKDKMRAAHLGKKHTEEAKRKIGDAHRGRIQSVEEVETRRQIMLKLFREEGYTHPNQGKKASPELRAIYSAAATKRERSYSPEIRAAISAKIGNGVRGLKRTPEQKERYREARVKYMTENPLSVKDTSGELAIKEWLNEHGIAFTQQFVIPGKSHPYDFFLPDYNTIIEFDGSHHWAFYWFNIKGKSDEEIAEMLEDQKAKDARENWEAGEAGHRIIRIYGYAAPGDSEHGSLEEQLRLQGFPMPDGGTEA